jgi:SPP1 gp7 family putative phage head morphogenesis protein
VEGAIRVGYAQGQTTEEIVKVIRGTKAANFSDGILGGVAKREGSAIVRTSIQQVSNQAQQAVYEANSDLVEAYEFIATLDDKTTTQCASLDRQVFPLGEGPIPPLHVNCRSVTIPKVKGVDLSEGRQRASVGADGGEPVDGRLSYFEWLKTQPAAFQDDAIGETRAQLLRRGGLSAEQFAKLNLGRDFQPLTLDQMRQKNPAAFARAGI